MTFRYLVDWLWRLGILGSVGLAAIGCVMLQPQDPAALGAISQANDAIAASKQAGAAERFPEEFAALETRYHEVRGVFYSCQEDQATQMAQMLMADAQSLAEKRPPMPEPPPPANQPPVARLEGADEGTVNELLTFNAADSIDPDEDELTYTWDYGDGTSPASFTFPVTTHRFTQIGNYNVRLTVDDGRGGTDTAMQLVRVVRRELFRSDSLFDFDSSRLKPVAEEVLHSIVQQMQADTGFHAELVGHTDSRGTKAYNRGLSKRRAEAVRDFLLSRGIAPERVTTDWRGEAEPVAPNDTDEGRARNRRTEITLKPPAIQ
ncbi:Peptidoglycan-associated lipoprotein [Candidatus Entotheonellaceae bacterium PAL068K]